MKDNLPDVQEGWSSPCPWSKDCERLADVLDGEWISEFEYSQYDHADVQLIQQLRAHIPHCASCREILRLVRRTHERERGILREYLWHAETRTPSTTASILHAIREESEKRTDALDPLQPLTTLKEERPRRSISAPDKPSSRRRAWSRGVSLAAVAAIVVLSFGLFSHLAWLHSLPPPSSQTPLSAQSSPQVTPATSPTPSLSFSSDWSSVVAFTSRAGQQGVEAFDPLNARHSTLAITGCKDAQPDAIAHSGKNVLYHCYDGHHTIFHLLTGQTYLLDGGQRNDGGEYNAVWSTDDRYLFFAVPHALVRVDIALNKIEQLSYSLEAVRLLFYYDNALYFSYSLNGSQGAETQLKRLNLADGTQEVLAHSSAPEPQFWLRPDGQMIYYTSMSEIGQIGIYAVGRDGGNTYLFSQDAFLVGFDQDNAPMVIRNVQGVWQLVRIDSVSQQEQIRVQDIAPGVSKVTVQAVLLSPYSRYLVAGGLYTDSSQHYWLTDLSTGSSHDFFDIPQQNNVLTPLWLGWSKIQP